MMEPTIVKVGQPVIVYEGSGRTRSRHEATVTKVGRKLATIEWPAFGRRRTESRQFRMSDRQENLPPSRTYAYSAVFRTLEQEAEAQRKHAAEDGLSRVGLIKKRADSLTLDEMEAVVKLLDEMRKNEIA
jgi:hypothetical protein